MSDAIHRWQYPHAKIVFFLLISNKSEWFFLRNIGECLFLCFEGRTFYGRELCVTELLLLQRNPSDLSKNTAEKSICEASQSSAKKARFCAILGFFESHEGR